MGQRKPYADAGADFSSTVDAPTTFDGTRSSDPDGYIVSYSWDFGDGTTGGGPGHARLPALGHLQGP